MTLKGDIKVGMVWFLSSLLLLAVVATGRWPVLLLSAVTVGEYVILDLIYLRHKTKRWIAPWNGVISALVIACVLSPGVPLVVWILAPMIAVLCKRLIRPGRRPLFNPAAFALLTLSFFWPQIIGWWVGANGLLIAYLIFGALFICWRLKKWRIVASFAVAYYGALALLYGPAVIIAPWTDPTVIFFVGVMLIEPMTTAYRKNWLRIFYGAAVGLLAVGFSLIPSFPVDLFLAALLTANLLARIAGLFPIAERVAV